MVSLMEIAERCEKATGPDRALDLDIGAALDVRGRRKFEIAELRDFQRRNGRLPYEDIAMTWLPLYTSSLDAALSLVPEGWRVNGLYEDSESAWWSVGLRKADNSAAKTASAASPALALCAAALRARAAT